MKFKNVICLLTIISASSAGCAHWSDQQKRIASFGLGTIIGIGLSSAASQDASDADQQATQYAYAGAGMALGFTAGEILFPGSNGGALEKADAEMKKYKEMDRNEGRLLLGDSLIKGPSRVKCPDGTTAEAAQIFCTDSTGELGNCQDLGFRYISSELAVAFVGYYSPNGCYPPPYNANPGLKQYFKPLIEQARKELQK